MTSSAAPLGPGDREEILSRLERGVASLTACECGSRSWCKPEGPYLLSAPCHSSEPVAHDVPAKLMVAITCPNCGLTKLYDPTAMGLLPPS